MSSSTFLNSPDPVSMNHTIFPCGPHNMSRTFIYKNYSISMHTHEYFEINVVLGGSGTHYIDKSTVSVKKGDVFVITPGVMHGYLSDGDLDVYHLTLKPDFIKRYRVELEATPGFQMLFEIEPQLRKATGDRYFMRLDYDMLNTIRKEADTMKMAYENGLFEYNNVLALKAVCDLSIKMNQSIKETQRIDKKREEIMHVMEYIQNNLDKRLTVDELADVAFMSKSTFNRHFKAMLHTTPTEYVIGCRIQKARVLIEEDKLSRTEIAQLCGFYDLSHMDKYLKAAK